MEDLDREHFCIIMLNVRNQIIAREVISVGSLDTSIAHPREIFKNCIKKSAATVILAHNHPSGDAAPSDDDIKTVSYTHLDVYKRQAYKMPVINSLMDGLGIGVAYTLNLMVLGGIREFFGTGQITLGGTAFPSVPAFEPAAVMLTPPGGFITLGVLMALLNIAVMKWGKGKETGSGQGHC